MGAETSGDPIKERFMNPDALYAFAVGEVALIGSVFVHDPQIALACQLLGGSLNVLGLAFHLDGK